MKFSINQLSIALVLCTVACAQAATAQEGGGPKERGNRFVFAPNIYRSESARIPSAPPAEIHNVRAGSVPTGNSLLGGNDPSFFSKAPAQMPAPYVQQNVTPRLIATPVQAKPSYNAAFGRPAQAIAMQPSTAPMAPAMAQPSSMQKPVMRVAKAAPRNVNTGVTGRLASRPAHRPSGLSAGPAVASYKPGMGYTAGSFLPTQSAGGSTTTQATVSGRVLQHK